MSSRPALLPVDHPLSYSTLPKRQSLSNGATNGHGPFHSLKVTGWANPHSLEDKVAYLYERQQLVDLLNEYAYRLDACMVEHAAAREWSALFTADCEVTYPFGTHRGVDGLAEWAMNAETRFHRMMHSSSNFTIVFESDTIAHARSALLAVCGTDPEDLGKIFSEGGYYYWSFRKEANGLWRISYLFLDVNWTFGDSLGLNEPGAAD